MIFASDNWAGAHPAIASALSDNTHGFAPAYGNSLLDRRVEQRFRDIFERDVAVFFVATGTAANALSLTAVNKAGGVCFTHSEAHVIADECGAPEYFTGGARLVPVEGPLSRIDPARLDEAIRRYSADFIHAGRPMAVSITQATESGTVYGLDHIAAIGKVCREHGVPLHMDGARFANALVRLGCSPAEMSWRSGVDILSFGGTKNGCWCAEAIVIFDPDKARDMPYLRKRAAQLFSKSRFVAAQFDAYFENGLWLSLARHANSMTERLAAHVEVSGRLRLAWKTEANEAFIVMSDTTRDELKNAGVVFNPWHAGANAALAPGEAIYRFVTSFATTAEEIDQFGKLIA